MDEVKELIDQYISEINTISDIAIRLDISPETLRKNFLRNEKRHLHDYIYECKVQLMRELLTISDDSCYSICDRAGLRADTGARIFKKITGFTMRGFRERYKKEYELLKDDSTQKHRLHDLLTEAFNIDPECDVDCVRYHKKGFHTTPHYSTRNPHNGHSSQDHRSGLQITHQPSDRKKS